MQVIVGFILDPGGGGDVRADGFLQVQRHDQTLRVDQTAVLQDDKRLEQLAYLKHVPDDGQVDGTDDGAVLRIDGNEHLMLQLIQGLTHGGAAHAQLGAERHLIEHLIRGIDAVEDAGFDNAIG